MGSNKRATIDQALFTRTDATAAGPVEVPAEGRTESYTIGMKESEHEFFTTIANDLGVTKHALGRFALRWFLKEYLAGRVDMGPYLGEQPPQPKRPLDMP